MAEQEPIKPTTERKRRNRVYQPKRIDLTDQRFGRLTVLGFAEIRNEQAAWRCRCECGADLTVVGYSLRSRGTRSCGCYVRDRARQSARPLVERFWAKVAKSEDGCWLWMSGLDREGYGHIYRQVACRVSKGILAHRFSYELAFGSIPDGMDVLHRCDVPACVRPDHLWLGTHQDNMTDMVRKGRSPRGERSGRTFLTDDDVQSIYDEWGGGRLSLRKLAKKRGVSATLISKIVKGQHWRQRREV